MILLRHRIIWQPTDSTPAMNQITPFLPGLSPVQGKSLTATFDGGRMSSDGGVVVLREIALRLGLGDVITGPLPDNRDPMRVTHSYDDMALARMMAIAAGYEDCDDLDSLRTDPAGVVTLSQIERNWPITTNAEAWDSNDFACCSVAEIRLIALNVTTPFDCHFF
jgi:hypothetical protein